MSSSSSSSCSPSSYSCYCNSGTSSQWISSSADPSGKSHEKTANGYPIQLLLSACIDAAEMAGQVIANIFHGGKIGVKDKVDDSAHSASIQSAPSSYSVADKEKMDALIDPQTLADTESQKILVGSLSSAFPTLRIIGEEGHQESSKPHIKVLQQDKLKDIHFPSEYSHFNFNDFIVYVDPLDGTKEFTVGNTDGVTILLGIVSKHNGRALGGVIYQPFRRRCIWSALGVGCFGIQLKSELIEHRRKNNILSVATTRSHATPYLVEALKYISAKDVVKIGGAGAKGILVLDGETDAYFFPTIGTCRWDIAAVDAAFHSVNGCLTDQYGNSLDYRSKDSADSKADATKLAKIYSNSDGIIGTRDKNLQKLLILPKGLKVPENTEKPHH